MNRTTSRVACFSTSSNLFVCSSAATHSIKPAASSLRYVLKASSNSDHVRRVRDPSRERSNSWILSRGVSIPCNAWLRLSDDCAIIEIKSASIDSPAINASQFAFIPSSSPAQTVLHPSWLALRPRYLWAASRYRQTCAASAHFRSLMRRPGQTVPCTPELLKLDRPAFPVRQGNLFLGQTGSSAH